MLTHLFLLLAMAASQAVPFTDSRWMLLDREARPMPYLGQPSLFIDNGFALLRDSSFGDGTIEFDIAMHGHTSFAGVVFRAASSDDCELVYLRPFLSRQPDAVQYTPVFNGFFGWQLYNGKGYTGTAELPLNRWVHVKLVVAGYSAQLFIDRAQEPQLTVTSLKRPWARGMVGLWGNFGGANFANVVVSALDSTAPSSRPADSPPTLQPLTAWELSPAFETATTKPDVLPARGAVAAREWSAAPRSATTASRRWRRSWPPAGVRCARHEQSHAHCRRGPAGRRLHAIARSVHRRSDDSRRPARGHDQSEYLRAFRRAPRAPAV